MISLGRNKLLRSSSGSQGTDKGNLFDITIQIGDNCDPSSVFNVHHESLEFCQIPHAVVWIPAPIITTDTKNKTTTNNNHLFKWKCI